MKSAIAAAREACTIARSAPCADESLHRGAHQERQVAGHRRGLRSAGGGRATSNAGATVGRAGRRGGREGPALGGEPPDARQRPRVSSARWPAGAGRRGVRLDRPAAAPSRCSGFWDARPGGRHQRISARIESAPSPLALIDNDASVLGVVGTRTCARRHGRRRRHGLRDRGRERGRGTWSSPLGKRDLDAASRVRPPRCEGRRASCARSRRAHQRRRDGRARGRAPAALAEPVLMDSQAKYGVLAAGCGELLFRLLSPTKLDYRERIWDQAAGSDRRRGSGRTRHGSGRKTLDFSRGRTLAGNRGVVASNGELHDAALAAPEEGRRDRVERPGPRSAEQQAATARADTCRRARSRGRAARTRPASP